MERRWYYHHNVGHCPTHPVGTSIASDHHIPNTQNKKSSLNTQILYKETLHIPTNKNTFSPIHNPNLFFTNSKLFLEIQSPIHNPNLFFNRLRNLIQKLILFFPFLVFFIFFLFFVVFPTLLPPFKI
jgi:hypothetical protein